MYPKVKMVSVHKIKKTPCVLDSIRDEDSGREMVMPDHKRPQLLETEEVWETNHYCEANTDLHG